MIGSIPFRKVTKKVLNAPKSKNSLNQKRHINKVQAYKLAGAAGLTNAVYMKLFDHPEAESADDPRIDWELSDKVHAMEKSYHACIKRL